MFGVDKIFQSMVISFLTILKNNMFGNYTV